MRSRIRFLIRMVGRIETVNRTDGLPVTLVDGRAPTILGAGPCYGDIWQRRRLGNSRTFIAFSQAVKFDEASCELWQVCGPGRADRPRGFLGKLRLLRGATRPGRPNVCRGGSERAAQRSDQSVGSGRPDLQSCR